MCGGSAWFKTEMRVSRSMRDTWEPCSLISVVCQCSMITASTVNMAEEVLNVLIVRLKKKVSVQAPLILPVWVSNRAGGAEVQDKDRREEVEIWEANTEDWATGTCSNKEEPGFYCQRPAVQDERQKRLRKTRGRGREMSSLKDDPAHQHTIIISEYLEFTLTSTLWQCRMHVDCFI